MDEHAFRTFLAERPALHISILAEELGMDRLNLYKILNGLCEIPKAKRGRFFRVAQKYEYIP